jgi:hypothetical protein
LRFLLGENGDQQIRTRHFLLARTLNVENSALKNPLETESWLSVSPIIRIRE